MTARHFPAFGRIAPIRLIVRKRGPKTGSDSLSEGLLRMRGKQGSGCTFRNYTLSPFLVRSIFSMDLSVDG